MRARHLMLALWVPVIMTVPARVSAGQIMLSVSTHGMLADLGGGLEGAFDLVLATSWAPIPELTIGLEGAITLPAHSISKTDLTLRAAPVAQLRFGGDHSWSYIKLGCGLDSHLREGKLNPVLVLVGALGFAVAPSEVHFFFGFEISGELDVIGKIPSRTLGVGGVLGYRF